MVNKMEIANEFNYYNLRPKYKNSIVIYTSKDGIVKVV